MTEKMKGNKKRIISFFLVLSMVLTVFPQMIPDAQAAAPVSDQVIKTRIDELYSMLGGKYFNTTQSNICGKKSRGHGCKYCDTGNIVKAKWFKDKFGTLKTSQFYSSGQSCVGFAWFAEWYIHRANDKDTIAKTAVGSYKFTYDNMINYVHTGDFLWDGSHAMVFISADKNGITVLDNNYKGSYNCMVAKHKISYNKNKNISVSRVYSKTNGPTTPTKICTVTLNSNGGSEVSPIKVTSGKSYGTLPTPTRKNYTFDGWYTAKSGGTRVTSTTKVTKNHTLYAHWKSVPTSKPATCTVTLNSNGGNKVSPVSIKVASGKTYGTLPTPTRSGYKFDGWYTAKSGGSKVKNTTKVTKNHTLYAHWTKVPTTSTTTTAKDLPKTFAAEAKKYVGYNETQFEKAIGKSVPNNGWGVAFVSRVAEKVGASKAVPYYTITSDLFNGVTKAGGSGVCFSSADKSKYFRDAKVVKRGNYTPKIGDIVFIDWNSLSTRVDNVSIVRDVNTNTKKMSIVYGNAGNGVVKQVNNVPYATSTISGGSVLGFVTPNWAAASNTKSMVSPQDVLAAMDLFAPLPAVGNEVLVAMNGAPTEAVTGMETIEATEVQPEEEPVAAPEDAMETPEPEDAAPIEEPLPEAPATVVGITFVDQGQIKHTEAVDGCVELNIINGYFDGSFQPNGSISRSEICKMIAVVLNGGSDPYVGSASAAFSDVSSDNWAMPYIAYCYNREIVSGVGNGCFAPYGNVTVDQAAKMLLVILGYNPADYVGSQWAEHVHTDAMDAGLFYDMTNSNGSTALTRDDAAQMIWNALHGLRVKYEIVGNTTHIEYLNETLLAHCYPNFAGPSEPTPEEPVNPDPKPEAWKQAYRDYIVRDAQESGCELSYSDYYLVYLDGDDIPELYIYYSPLASGQKLCTYQGGTLSSLNLADSALYFIPKANQFMLSCGRMDTYWESVYRIDHGAFVETARGDITGNGYDENEEMVYSYTWNGSPVSQEEYDANLFAAFDVDRASDAFDETSYTYDEILQMLSE